MRPKVSPGLHQIKVSKKYCTWNRGDSLKYEIPSTNQYNQLFALTSLPQARKKKVKICEKGSEVTLRPWDQ